MLLLTKPSQEQIKKFISSQQGLPFSCSVTIDDSEAPSRYTIDHNRIKLGTGATVYARAIAAIKRWEMFNLGWVTLCWPDAPIQQGVTVAVLVDHFGFSSLNACRVVRVIDDDSAVKRFGFAYGTLPDHIERGQETFTVEWQSKDNSVWYDIFAYSRPNHFLAKLGYPLARMLQKRFALDSMKAMLRASR
jgi:uncharacterized protein (UPF0548 family)